MCLNTRSNNIHNTDGHVIKTLLLDYAVKRKKGKVPHGEQVKQLKKRLFLCSGETQVILPYGPFHFMVKSCVSIVFEMCTGYEKKSYQSLLSKFYKTYRVWQKYIPKSSNNSL